MWRLATRNMEYTRLGTSGLKISPIILGTMGFGNPKWEGWVMDEDHSLPILEHAYNCGINTWDTADFYSHGDSERIIGKALKAYKIPRENVTILTKCYFGVSHDGNQLPLADCVTNNGPMVNRVGLSRKHIFDAVDASVSRLGTYIDLLQIHRLDRDPPMEEIMGALNDVVQSGKVRYIGASSMAAWEFQKMQNIAEARGWHRFVSMQNYLNLLYREEEREMIPYCKATGVGVIPWSPVARGILGRPWGSAATKREGTDAYLSTLITRESEADKAIVDRVEQLAKRIGVPMASVATAWVLSKGLNPVLGLSSRERIDKAIEATRLQLSKEDIEYLEEPYQPKNVTGY
ncbi:NADP-dependent oxidoreductase domain-containing protein [Exophiala viscosa]|uniref:NADP-dependent oxidoreductase domain-containing protein n=1 Tax=Exophiala viscosa TaxID=2486360 RepID=UPI00218E0395|nr:NADP-dependent oxidoreductase domain-containing protein [Exophiala viscosa]